FFRLAELSADDAFDEPSAISGLEFVERVGGTKRCPIDRYRFPPQEVKRPEGEVRSGTDLKVGAIAGFNQNARTIDIKKASAAADVHPSTVFFHQRFNPAVLQDALFSLGTSVADRGMEGDGEFAALRALLVNAAPILDEGTLAPVVDESPIDRARRVAVALRTSVLPVQGQPGSGKTYTGAKMACELVRVGRRVGTTGTR